MARILYGVAGEGSGHSSRAKEILNHLEQKGHIVKVISYDKGYKNLCGFFDTEEISGLRFSHKNNSIRPIRTVIKNFIKAPEGAKSLNKVLKIADEFKPQIIFTDVEPISSIVANIKNIPLISIDNQHRLTKTKIQYPEKYKKEALIAKTLINLLVFNAKAYLVTDFLQPEEADKKTFLFPPILRKEVMDIKADDKDYVLIYLSLESDCLSGILKNIKENFIIYGFDEDRKDGNLTFKKYSQKDFLHDLSSAKAVIANAGLSLISEALYLGKPYLALPVNGQFEQIYNAYNLEKLGYGKFLEEPEKKEIELFLSNLDLYRNNLKKYKRENNSKIFKKIDSLIKKYAL